MNRRFLVSAAALLLLIPLLASCSDDDSSGPPAGRAPHQLRLDPETDVKVAKAASTPPSLAGDPLDNGGDRVAGHDPLDSGTDALSKDSDPGEKTSSRDPLSSVGTTNWYWLRGSISGGTVIVEVNGVTLGQYSVHMDKEITRMLHPGSNSLTFAPQRDNPQAPVQADLEVVYSQMSPGQLPPLVYDTRQVAQPSETSIARAPASVYKPVEGSESSSSSSDPIPHLAPPTPAPATVGDSPTTLTFVAQ